MTEQTFIYSTSYQTFTNAIESFFLFHKHFSISILRFSYIALLPVYLSKAVFTCCPVQFRLFNCSATSLDSIVLHNIQFTVAFVAVFPSCQSLLIVVISLFSCNCLPLFPF